MGRGYKRQSDIDDRLVRMLDKALKKLTTDEYVARYSTLDKRAILHLPLRGVTSLPSRAAPGALGRNAGGPHLVSGDEDDE